jgi:hypothetical protein
MTHAKLSERVLRNRAKRRQVRTAWRRPEASASVFECESRTSASCVDAPVEFGQAFGCGVDNSGSGVQGVVDVGAEVKFRDLADAEGDRLISTTVLSLFLLWPPELAPRPIFPSYPRVFLFLFKPPYPLVHEIRRRQLVEFILAG